MGKGIAIRRVAVRPLLRAGIAASAALLACRGAEREALREEPKPAAAAAAATPPSAEPGAVDAQKLVGRWMRSDSNYVIVVAGAGADGSLEVKYLNPQPIHVSRAEWSMRGEHLLLAVELMDQNYPGNFYALAYDPGSDALVGVYHHLGLNQRFEVAFSRVME